MPSWHRSARCGAEQRWSRNSVKFPPDVGIGLTSCRSNNSNIKRKQERALKTMIKTWFRASTPCCIHYCSISTVGSLGVTCYLLGSSFDEFNYLLGRFFGISFFCPKTGLQEASHPWKKNKIGSIQPVLWPVTKPTVEMLQYSIW
jgi:hypothetical protein